MHEVIAGPATWHGAEMLTRRNWTHEVASYEIVEIMATRIRARRRSLLHRSTNLRHCGHH